MKTSFFAAAIAVALATPVTWADDMHMGSKPKSDKPGMNMGMEMHKGMQQPAAPAMNMGTDRQAGPPQADLDKMRQQMEKIVATTDPKARQKLMQEHMQTMQENMKAMRAMSPRSMGEVTATEDSASAPGSDVKKRQDMIEMRMEMMQEMMEQMMQRDKATKPMGDM